MLDEKAELEAENIATLREYNHTQSDIPMTHKYWENKKIIALLNSQPRTEPKKVEPKVEKANEEILKQVDDMEEFFK